MKRMQQLICTFGLLAMMVTASAQTTHYYFINDSQQNLYARWGSDGKVVTVAPWQKRLLASDKSNSGTYQLALSHQPDNLQQAPLQLSLQLNKKYNDQMSLQLLSATGQQTLALKHSDSFKPSSLVAAVDEVQVNSSENFDFDNKSYHLYQADMKYNNIFSPTREVDITLHQTLQRYQRNDNDANQLDILTYNVQLWDDFSDLGGMRLNQASRRATLIPTKIANYDVVVAEELMSEDGLQGRRKKFVAAMKQQGYSYSYGPIPRSLGLSSGVMIFSHWPLSHFQQLKYPSKDTHGVDSMSNKGVLYAQVNKRGKIYHLFATHTQADEPADNHSKDVAARDRQFLDLFGFIKAQHIHAGQPVIVAGDLNVDYAGVTAKSLSNPVIAKSLSNPRHCEELAPKQSGLPRHCVARNDEAPAVARNDSTCHPGLVSCHPGLDPGSSQNSAQEYQATIAQLTSRNQAWDNMAGMPYGSNPAINLMNTDSTPAMVDYILMLGQPFMATQAFTKHSRIRVIRAPEVAQMYAGGHALDASKKPFAELDLSDHFSLEAELYFSSNT
ncbi:MAG: endonuclease/exonuclease/phosphatase family protein [Coxiellaceae bacterium]|nr:endonuclease/exonuclease/phosphatase family protein [Coxiellaceae bacterium]